MSEGMTWWRDAGARLGSQGARRWYWGSIWGIAYLAIPASIVWVNTTADVTVAVLLTILVLVIAAVYVVIPPLIWGRGPTTAAAAMLGFLALTCLAFPLIGLDTVWFWIYVPVMVSMSWQRRGFSLVSIAVIVIAQLAVVSAAGRFGDYWYAAALTASIGIMMLAFSQQIQVVRRLRDAQGEIARLAVVDERARFARDMHDVLGHSLTVVAVKSELARKLVRLDPQRAENELADIERLSRGALADLRSAVTGYHEMSLPAEIAAAQAALAAAEIEAHLPPSVEGVAPELSDLFAWVLRESVTNVIRHSGAHNCWIVVERRCIRICDDGRGGAVLTADATRASRGHGLDGLAERAAQAGATLTVGEREDCGTIVTARGAPA